MSDYKKLKPSPDKIADLMLFYVENACQFTNEYGDMWEQYYTSVENNFNRTMAFMNKNGPYWSSSSHASRNVWNWHLHAAGDLPMP